MLTTAKARLVVVGGELVAGVLLGTIPDAKSWVREYTCAEAPNEPNTNAIAPIRKELDGAERRHNVE